MGTIPHSIIKLYHKRKIKKTSPREALTSVVAISKLKTARIDLYPKKQTLSRPLNWVHLKKAVF